MENPSSIPLVGVTNVSPFDGWSLLHGGVGFVAGLLRVPFWVFLIGIVSYEIVEYRLEYPHGSKLFGTKRPESTPNMLTDLAVDLAAYMAARALIK